MNRVFHFSCWTISIALVIGCARVRQGEGFDDTRDLLSHRGIEGVEWRGISADDDAVDEAIRNMLESELSIDQAVQIALLNNRNLQATYEDLGIAQVDLVQAGLLRNPIFSGEIRFPGPAVEISVVQQFLDVFLIPIRKKAAQSAFESAKLRVADAVLDLAAQTQAAYFHHQAAMQILEMRQTIAQATEASAQAAQQLRDAGNIRELDLVNELASHEQSLLDLQLAEANARDTHERLSALMGLSGSESPAWKIVPRLAEPDQDQPSLGEIEQTALSQRLDLAAAKADIEQFAQSTGLARRSGLVPELSIGGAFEREADGERTAGPTVRFPLPIFTQNQAGIARAEAQLRQRQQRYLSLANQIRSEVRLSLQRMQAAQLRADRHRAIILPLRQRILEQAQLQYNAMQIGLFELLAARREQIEAGKHYVEALRDYWLARGELERALGVRLSVPATQPATAPVEKHPVQQQQHHDHH